MNIEYVVTRIEPISKEESMVSVDVKPELRFNGFSGGTMRFSVNNKTQKDTVRERVKWKVIQETGTNIEETGGKFIERSAA